MNYGYFAAKTDHFHLKDEISEISDTETFD